MKFYRTEKRRENNAHKKEKKFTTDKFYFLGTVINTNRTAHSESVN